MDKDYVKQSLKQIRNPDDVNYIISTRHKDQMFIVAGLTDGREIQLTLARSAMSFSSKPMYDLAQVMGLLYMEDFVSVCNGYGCINRNNFESFHSMIDAKNPKYLDLIAKFKNGKAVNLYAIKEKNFEKEKAKLEVLLSEEESDWTYQESGSFLGL